MVNNLDKRGGEVVGLNPNIRIYRYSPGQFFDAHCKFHRPCLVTAARSRKNPSLDLTKT